MGGCIVCSKCVSRLGGVCIVSAKCVSRLGGVCIVCGKCVSRLVGCVSRLGGGLYGIHVQNDKNFFFAGA